MEGRKGSSALLALLLLLLVASCPSSSADGARDDGSSGAEEAAVTRADCDEFVHRIFNMSVAPHRDYTALFAACEWLNTTMKCYAPPTDWFDRRVVHEVPISKICDGRYDCAAMGDDAGMGNDEKGCYVFEYKNGFLFVVCALSFIFSLSIGPVALVHLERVLCGRESGVLSCRGFDGRDRVDAERSVDGGGGDEDFEDEEVGKKETAAPRAGGGSYSNPEIKKWVRFYALLSQPSTAVYGDLHSSYRQLRECANYSKFLSKTVALVSLCGPETALARLYWLERSCHEFGSRVDAKMHFIKCLRGDRVVLGVMDAAIDGLPDGGDRLSKGGLGSAIQNNVVYAYPRLFSFVGHFLVSANEMFNYYIDLFRDTLLILGIGLASEIRMRPDVASDVGDMILTFAFLSLAPYVVNVFIVALHKGVRFSTRFFMVGAFFPFLPGMTMYRTFRTELSVDSHRLRLRNLLLNERPPAEIREQMSLLSRAELDSRRWSALREKLFHCQLYLEHIPSVIMLFQIGFGGTYLWKEAMGNIQANLTVLAQPPSPAHPTTTNSFLHLDRYLDLAPQFQTNILVMQLFEAPPYVLSVIVGLTAFGVVIGQYRSAHYSRETYVGLPARVAYAAFLVIGNLGSYLALYAAMVLGLIYGMVDHTYFMDLLILYAVLAAKFAVMFAVTWAISRVFREKLKPREKVIRSLAQVLCPNIFEDFELDQSRSAWNRLLAQYGAAHAVHLAFNVLIVYSNNVFHVVPFPLPGGYLALLGICAAVSAAQMVPAYIYYRLLHPRKSILDRELRDKGESVTVNRCIGRRDSMGDDDREETFWAFERVWKNAPYSGACVEADFRREGEKGYGR